MTSVFSLPLCRTPPQRILALAFPYLATDRIARRRWGPSWRSAGRPEHPPVVCAGRTGNATRLTALDEKAEACGLRPGLGLAQARAMFSALDAVAADERADAAFLGALADWCERYTPLVAFDGQGDGGLYLDITGCAALCGGERPLLDDLVARLSGFGVAARAAISPSPGLSFALARFGPGGIVGADEGEAAAAPLPVRALRLPEETVAALLKTGLRRIGDLMALPRAPLARRFGPLLLRRLDQMLGREEEAISPRRPVAALSAERRLCEPVRDEAAVLALAGRLAAGLTAGFEARAEGGRLFELLLFRVDGHVFRLEAGASRPLKDPARIAALFSGRFEALHDELDAGFGFEALRLSVLASEALPPVQEDLASEAAGEASLAAFVDETAARYGRDCLQVALLHASHVPERAARMAPAMDAPARAEAPAGMPVAARPVRLFRHPEPVEAIAAVPEGPPALFRWRRVTRRVAWAEGPERIAAEWWIDGEDAPTRDYYRVEDEEGHGYWLFRKGLYGRETDAPRWFMHGLFA